MGKPEFPLIGTCRCGAVSIEITAPAIMRAACHCRGCQRMSSSAYSLTVMVPTQAFRVTAGEPVKGGLKGAQLDHYCCPSCMTWMFTRFAGNDDFLNVRPTMFDDMPWSEPFVETMTAEKLPWATTPARYSYENFPPPEDFPKLLEEFAASR